jgi:hypothetical protein
MTTTIKIELASQSKSVVPKVQVVSDDLTEDEIVEKVKNLFARMEDIAIPFALRRQ